MRMQMECAMRYVIQQQYALEKVCIVLVYWNAWNADVNNLFSLGQKSTNCVFRKLQKIRDEHSHIFYITNCALQSTFWNFKFSMPVAIHFMDLNCFAARDTHSHINVRLELEGLWLLKNGNKKIKNHCLSSNPKMLRIFQIFDDL